MFGTIAEKVIVGVLVAIIVGGIYWIVDRLSRIPGTIGVPSGAVVAFSTSCPTIGWEEFEEANGRFIVGAGVPTNPKHREWQQVLPDGSLSQPIQLTTYELHRSGGEEKHRLSLDEIPSHTHNQVWGQGAGTPGTSMLGNSFDGRFPISDMGTSTKPAGGGEGHNNIPPYYPLHWCKKS